MKEELDGKRLPAFTRLHRRLIEFYRPGIKRPVDQSFRIIGVEVIEVERYLGRLVEEERKK